MSDKIRIVFDDGPGPVGGTFIEVEDEQGHSLSFGEWKQEGDLWYLEFDNPASLQAEVAKSQAQVEDIDIAVEQMLALEPLIRGKDEVIDECLTNMRLWRIALLSKEPDET